MTQTRYQTIRLEVNTQMHTILTSVKNTNDIMKNDGLNALKR